VGLAAAAAAVTANLVLLGQARSDDPMGRLSPALEDALLPEATTTAVADPAPPATAPATVAEPVRTDEPDDGDEDDEDD